MLSPQKDGNIPVNRWASCTIGNQSAFNKAELASPSYRALATSIATSCFFSNHSAIHFRSGKIVDQCSSEAGILSHQAGHSFDLSNFVTERLCSLIEGCALNGLLSHETQKTNVVAPVALGIGIMKKDGNGWPPVSSRSTELLKVILDRRRVLPMNNHSHV